MEAIDFEGGSGNAMRRRQFKIERPDPLFAWQRFAEFNGPQNAPLSSREGQHGSRSRRECASGVCFHRNVDSLQHGSSSRHASKALGAAEREKGFALPLFDRLCANRACSGCTVSMLLCGGALLVSAVVAHDVAAKSLELLFHFAPRTALLLNRCTVVHGHKHSKRVEVSRCDARWRMRSFL